MKTNSCCEVSYENACERTNEAVREKKDLSSGGKTESEGK